MCMQSILHFGERAQPYYCCFLCYKLQTFSLQSIVNCRCQVTAEKSVQEDKFTGTTTGWWVVQYLIATVSSPWHRQKYFTQPAATISRASSHQPLLVPSVSISGCNRVKSGGPTSISGHNPAISGLEPDAESLVWSVWSGHLRFPSTSPLLCSSPLLSSRQKPWR